MNPEEGHRDGLGLQRLGVFDERRVPSGLGALWAAATSATERAESPTAVPIWMRSRPVVWAGPGSARSSR